MIEQTRKNLRKAWIIADFLNRTGYFSRNFFDADEVLKKCEDEQELYWWYKKCQEFGGQAK